VNCKTLVSVMAYLPSMESRGFETPHDTPPHPFMPSPTCEYSSNNPLAIFESYVYPE